MFTRLGLNLLISKFQKQPPELVYDEWIKARIAKASQIQRKDTQPKITIAISVYQPNADRLMAAINSVIAQTWQNC